MTDYCLFPSQCGLGMDCSACMGGELRRRAKRIAELEARLAEAERDVGRYRWLRGQCSASGKLTIARVTDWSLEGWSGDDPDAAIDSARGQHANSK